MAQYWCETCGGKIVGKNFDQVFSHLKTEHDIVILESKYAMGIYLNNTATCTICSEVLTCRNYNELQKRKGEHIAKHRKYAIKVNGEYKEFVPLISVLHYVDTRFNVHIGYTKGFGKSKTVFLDGICR